MTTIAWDGVSMAADRGVENAGLFSESTKIFRIVQQKREMLVGVTGDVGYCLRIVNWMRTNKNRPHPTDYYQTNELHHTTLLAAIRERNGRVKLFEMTRALDWIQLHGQIHAAGAGREIAIGAMEAGATAHAAVQIAMRRSLYAAIGVDVLTFERPYCPQEGDETGPTKREPHERPETTI